jgi:hypothetical protein
MIAIGLFAVGLLSVLALFSTAIATTEHAQEDLIAKQRAREALEAIYSARDDSDLTFNAIANQPLPGIFKVGFEPLYRIDPSSNEIVGSASEGTTPDYVLAPDANGELTQQVPLTNFERQIDIEPVTDGSGNINPNLKIVTVTVRVMGGTGGFRDYKVVGYISKFH